MKNRDVLIEVFAKSFGIDTDQVTETLEFNSIPEWDSVSHMVLVAAIDSRFDIMLETDDVIDMSTFKKAIEILKKYGLEF